MHNPDKCKAHARNGDQCKNAPMAGQAVCRMHGGKSPGALAAAKVRLEEKAAVQAVTTYGLPRDVDPHSALLEELHRTAGHVTWLGIIVGALDTEQGRGKLVENTMFGEQPAIWLKLYEKERRHFAEVAKICISAGIAERQVKLAEERAQLMADVFREVFADPELGLTGAQQQIAVRTTARHLRLVGE